MKKTTIGSGLTAMSVLTFSFEEWIQKARENPNLLGELLPTYPERLLRWRDWATRVLEEAHRPTDDKLIEVKSDGTWAYVSEIDRFAFVGPESARLIAGLDYSDDEEEETKEWYASQILRWVNHELAHLRPNRDATPLRSKISLRTAEERRLANLASRGTEVAPILRTAWRPG